MKKIVVAVVLCALLGVLWGESWEIKADMSLLFNQNAYSDNWDGTESGSINWTMNFNGLAQKQLTPIMHNKNTLKLAFGQTHSQDKETKDWARPEKSTDLIDFESMLRFTLGSYVDPFAAFRWESQFYDNSVPGDTKIINPMTFTESFGIAKIFKQASWELSTRLGAAFKQFDDTREDGFIDKNDGGIEFVGEYRTAILDNQVSFLSKLILYKALYNSNSDDLEGTEEEDYWKETDVTWENVFSTNIAKYLTVNLTTKLIYDKETSLKGQFKETLSLGLTYQLF
ncbi:MAG: DUF3078 domain-containing protein [Candidatus Cloacimonetes bacterium]|nr:DUF3078 domain-containing protein [Candidatus Cloacimonadota bacterium]